MLSCCSQPTSKKRLCWLQKTKVSNCMRKINSQSNQHGDLQSGLGSSVGLFTPGPAQNLAASAVLQQAAQLLLLLRREPSCWLYPSKTTCLDQRDWYSLFFIPLLQPPSGWGIKLQCGCSCRLIITAFLIFLMPSRGFWQANLHVWALFW